MSYRLGIDVGGTFTDFLVLGDAVQLVHKTSSTPHDPSRGVRPRAGGDRGAARRCRSREFMASIDLIVHGTTVSTNAALTGNGARTGALLTEGFRDTLRLRDGTRATPYDNRLTPPRPLAPRERDLRRHRARRPGGAGAAASSTRTSVRVRGRGAARGRRGGRGDLLPALAAEPGARAARAGARPRGAPRRVRDRVARPAVADPLLPAHEHDGAERLRRPDHQPLHDGADRAPRRAAVRRRPAHHAVQRRGRDARRGVAPRRALAAVRVRPPGRPPGSSTCRAPASATASPSTWAAPASTSRWCATGRR